MNDDRTGARGPMNEQPLHLRRMIRAVWKRWLLVLALGCVGCVGGYLVGSRQQSTYVTAATVLLPPAPVDAQGKPTRNMTAQPNLTLDGDILQRAGRAVAPPIGVPRMRELIKLRALTSDILEVRAEAPSRGDAALLADAVAKEFVAEASDTAAKQAAAAISGLEAQVVKVEARLQQTEADIGAATAVINGLPPGSPDRLRQAAIIDGLRVEQVEAARQLASLRDRIAAARLQGQLSREGTRMLAPAIIPTEPSQPKPLLFGAGGTLLGLMVGVLLALLSVGRQAGSGHRFHVAQPEH